MESCYKHNRHKLHYACRCLKQFKLNVCVVANGTARGCTIFLAGISCPIKVVLLINLHKCFRCLMTCHSGLQEMEQNRYVFTESPLIPSLFCRFGGNTLVELNYPMSISFRIICEISENDINPIHSVVTVNNVQCTFWLFAYTVT